MKYEQSRWIVYKKKNGDEVSLIDLYCGVLNVLNTFKAIGVSASAIDPIHVGLPCAGVRFLLQVGPCLIQFN
jgi:hypothetical protein